MKVLSIPSLNQLSDSESGIHTVVRAYFRHAPDFGVQYVTPDDDFDLVAIHAGTGRAKQEKPVVCHLHGLYWTADYYMPNWAYRSNQHIIDVLRHAREITVPSSWVAETIQRDMHISPHVVPHGIDWESWQHTTPRQGYVVGYAKNRAGIDVCNPEFLAHLAPRFPKTHFYATFSPPGPDNVSVTGILPHHQMKRLVQGASVFISTTKETWGIAMLEAMAAGVPILAYRHGGAAELVQHGVTGYLAAPDNLDDLEQGLNYCIKYSQTLGDNAREVARAYTWQAAMEKVVTTYQSALSPRPPLVTVVIPAYNKDKYLERAVESVLSQTYNVAEVIIVDNNSTDNTGHVGRSLAAAHDRVTYLNEPLQGVAHARNAGIRRSLYWGKYVCCLDADDWLDPRFIGACVQALEADPSLGLAYTGITWHREDGASGNSDWPPDYDYDRQLKRKNQVPTCCVFRRDLWERSGGYRQRYAPDGAGAEDAEFWTRLGSLGYPGKRVTDAGLFHYQFGGSVSSDPNYREVDWLGWHPWTRDGHHPFASVATPVRSSHPVRQYDQPVVSVVIPVGPNHLSHVVDALDSLEAQTFRQWEAIVVMDNLGEYDPASDPPTAWWADRVTKPYPFVRILNTYDNYRSMGAGYARNRGAEIARAPFLLFLDADDWLYPDCLEKMLNGWGATGKGIYSDYIGIAYIEDTTQLAPNLQRDILEYNPAKKRATIRYRASNFDRDRALMQPEDPPYLWCNITTLIPTTWHHEIGGFDESMSSWEDVDYWHRMARAGHEFHRLQEPLLVYRFDTGNRRETGRQKWSDLLGYMRDKRNNEDGL